MACSEAPKSSIPTFQVEQKKFNIEIPAFGELEAEHAKFINAPGRRPMMIEWMAQENTLVKKGEVVARFDAEKLTLDSRKEELEMMLLDEDIVSKKAEKTQQQNALESDKVFVSKEYEFVDAFAIDDLRLYSKLEIIETLSNRDYLGAKDEFIEWKQDSIGERIQSSVDVLDIRKKGHEAKFKQHQSALAKLEVIAPFDGMLVYQKNHRGEKPSVGQTVYPGSVIAKLPNLEQMQAKIYVLDKNAIDLKPEQKVEVRLEAYPDKLLMGTVKSVSGFSRSIDRGNPTKYFDVVVTLPKDKMQLKPGSKVLAKIIVQDEVQKVVIPLQAIFSEKGENYVYLKQGSGFVRQTIKTENKNLHFVEVSEGLSSGDVIALSVPEQV
nr:efflux RND transporter periplasmic adaptor subunit [Paraglaciecola sp. G1-23]